MSNVVWISSESALRLLKAQGAKRKGRIMSDLEFETRLDRMFAEAPHFPDAELFARQVEARMERGWSLRRFVIGGAGVVAGVVGVGQMMGAGLFLPDPGRCCGLVHGQRDAGLVEGQVVDLAPEEVLPGVLALLWPELGGRARAERAAAVLGARNERGDQVSGGGHEREN